MDSNKFSALLEIMKDYQIILLQETHLTTTDHTAYEIQLRAKGWESFWGHAQKEYKRPMGGVAIWLKQSLLTTGIVQSCTKIRQEQTRHILSIQLQCRGQQFVLSSVYMPQNNNQNKVQKCITALTKLARQYVVIWCGDFNFVEDTRDSSNLSKPQTTYAFTHMKWLKKISQTKLVQEASEHHLRSMQAFTHTATRSPWIQRRLDRIYCSVALMHYLLQVNVMTNTPCQSDHSSIASRIKLTHPVLQGPDIKETRRNRIPQQFLASPH
jgi:exonuclease III